jgi:hypothetical protein
MTEINRIHAFVCGGFAISWAVIIFALVTK